MLKKLFFVLPILLVLLACSKTAFTGRKQLNLIPTQTINQLSFTEYKTFLQQNKTLSSGKEVDMVRRIGND